MISWQQIKDGALFIVFVVAVTLVLHLVGGMDD